MATSWTQSDLDRLEAAIKTGARRVTYTSGTVEYHSLAEMLQLRATMRDEIASPTPSQAIFAGRVS